MELLTIFYAILAALTGVSVGDGASVRQPLVAAAQAEQIEVAMVAVGTLVPSRAPNWLVFGDFGRAQPVAITRPAAVPFRHQVAMTEFGRWHL